MTNKGRILKTNRRLLRISMFTSSFALGSSVVSGNYLLACASAVILVLAFLLLILHLEN